MNRKYEFVPGDEKVIAPGRTVKRIRALVATHLEYRLLIEVAHSRITRARDLL